MDYENNTPMKICKTLLSRGYTQQELADLVGVKQPTISRIAAGTIKDISYNTVSRLINLLAASNPRKTQRAEK